MIKKYMTINYPFYKVVADGGMSAPSIGEGRLVPALIIDIKNDIEVSELIQLHKGTLPGDIQLVWSLPKGFFFPKSIYLNLEFIRPMNLKFGIEFTISNQFSLIDGIIQSRAFYLITGKSSDKVSQLINESILIEVPNLNFDKKWNDMLFLIVKKKYKNMGASRKEAEAFASNHIKSMRDIWNIRRRNNSRIDS